MAADSEFGIDLPRTLVRYQTILSLVLVVVMAGAIGIVVWLAQSDAVADWTTRMDLRRFDEDIEHFMNRAGFMDFEDRVILQEMPEADYARGGVYFLGTSSMKWATKLWELPSERRRWIHNYGIGATNHEMQLQFVRHLVEHEGLLAAGGPQTMLVVGLYWSMGMNWETGFFESLWPRYGLFRYDRDAGIEPIAMAEWRRRWTLARARSTSFLSGSANRLARYTATRLGFSIGTTHQLRGPEAVHRYIVHTQPRNWESALDRQMEALDEFLDYTRARDVKCTFVFLPTRDAYAEIPQAVAYAQRVRTFCRIRSATLVDLADLLAEDEFWDMNHANVAGLDKLHNALMTVAEPHLRSIGVWN